MAEQVAAALSHESTLRNQFREALGYQADPLLERLLEVIKTFGEPVPSDIVDPQLLGLDTRVSQGEITNAIEYLYHLGLIRRNSDGLTPDPIVQRVLGGG